MTLIQSVGDFVTAPRGPDHVCPAGCGSCKGPVPCDG